MKFLIISCLIAASILATNCSPEPKFIYFPEDTNEGKLVKAYLEGSKGTNADERDIHYFLFTKNNPTTGQELIINDLDSIRNSNFDITKKVKIISHGFGGGDIQEGSSGGLKNGLLEHDEFLNLIVIDWKKLSAAPWYDTAAENTRLVGEKTARFAEFLVDNKFTTLDKLHCIGHSLGSHVCGFFGSNFLIGKIPRITASDPALPLFGNIGDEGRIDPTDAVFVDVIHAAGGPLTSGELAFMDPRGHLDFYPNGGKNQPGCTGLPEVVGACSHARAYEYFAESVTRDMFKACKCPSWDDFTNCDCSVTNNMGVNPNSSKLGYFFLTTNAEAPFGQG